MPRLGVEGSLRQETEANSKLPASGPMVQSPVFHLRHRYRLP